MRFATLPATLGLLMVLTSACSVSVRDPPGFASGQIPTEAHGVFRSSPSEALVTNPRDGLTYVYVPAGEFDMGCPEIDYYCHDNEKPPVHVVLKHGFYIGQTEVTQAAWLKVFGSNPSSEIGYQLPVDNLSWYKATDFCKAIGGRLPTEAEWEYAARAGDTELIYGTEDEVGWSKINGGMRLHPVAKKKPNSWMLYDMVGNAFEWTSSQFLDYRDAKVKIYPKTAAFYLQVLFVDFKTVRSGISRFEAKKTVYPIHLQRRWPFLATGNPEEMRTGGLRYTERDGWDTTVGHELLGCRCVIQPR